MIKPEGSETRLLTPELATEFATMKGTIGERPIRQARIDMLKNKLADGLFFSPRWAVARIGNETVRVNGQHSSTMLAEANGSFPHGMSVIIISLPRRNSPGNSMRYRDRAIAAKCVHAWNAWRRQTPTNLKYTPDAPFPEPI